VARLAPSCIVHELNRHSLAMLRGSPEVCLWAVLSGLAAAAPGSVGALDYCLLLPPVVVVGGIFLAGFPGLLRDGHAAPFVVKGVFLTMLGGTLVFAEWMVRASQDLHDLLFASAVSVDAGPPGAPTWAWVAGGTMVLLGLLCVGFCKRVATFTRQARLGFLRAAGVALAAVATGVLFRVIAAAEAFNKFAGAVEAGPGTS